MLLFCKDNEVAPDPPLYDVVVWGGYPVEIGMPLPIILLDVSILLNPGLFLFIVVQM